MALTIYLISNLFLFNHSPSFHAHTILELDVGWFRRNQLCDAITALGFTPNESHSGRKFGRHGLFGTWLSQVGTVLPHDELHDRLKVNVPLELLLPSFDDFVGFGVPRFDAAASP